MLGLWVCVPADIECRGCSHHMAEHEAVIYQVVESLLKNLRRDQETSTLKTCRVTRNSTVVIGLLGHMIQCPQLAVTLADWKQVLRGVWLRQLFLQLARSRRRELRVKFSGS